MKKIKIIPYGGILHLTDNFSEFKKHYERLSGYTAEEGSAGLTFDNQDGNYFVLVANGGIGTLVHELAHVCLMLSRRVQLADIVNDQEQFCYLIGYLTDQSLKALPSLTGK
jgi:hypothetical protein